MTDERAPTGRPDAAEHGALAEPPAPGDPDAAELADAGGEEPGQPGTVEPAEPEGPDETADRAGSDPVPSWRELPAAAAASSASPPELAVQEPGGTRSIDAQIARLHLRTGLLSLARAELETLAGWSALDREALVDLAEVRWRTGDLVGAGEAAAAYLEVGGDEPVAYCVAAEAALAGGRSAEAQAYAARVLDRAAGELDDLFAGQPRSGLWPAPAAPPAPTGSAPAHGPDRASWPAAQAMPQTSMLLAPADTPPAASVPCVGAGSAAAPASLPDGGSAPATPRPGTPEPVPFVAADELAEAERRLAAGELVHLATRLAFVLRLQSGFAPAVLSLADSALTRTDVPADELPLLHLVRGDAYRLLGREALAREATRQAGHALHPAPSAEEASPAKAP